MRKLFENATNYEKYVTYKEYDKGQLIVSEGDECKACGLIVYGEVNITTLTYMDREEEINRLGKDEIFGDALLLADYNRFLGDVVALEKTKICFISKSNWIKLLEDPVILKNYLSIISNKVQKIQKKVKIISQSNLRDRILFYLFDTSKIIKSKTIPIKSKESLAQYLNIPRPSLSRELINMKNDGLIDFDRYSIKLL